MVVQHQERRISTPGKIEREGEEKEKDIKMMVRGWLVDKKYANLLFIMIVSHPLSHLTKLFVVRSAEDYEKKGSQRRVGEATKRKK